MIIREPIVTIPPDALPVTLDDVKEYLRISDTDEHDGTLEQLLTDAITWLERRVQRSLMTQTRALSLDTFPFEEIKIPFGPVQDIVSIEYESTAGSVTLDPTGYSLRDLRVFPDDNWPTDATLVTVTFVAGYETAEDVPGPLKQALRLKVQQDFDGVDNKRRIDEELAQYWQPVA